MFLSTPSRGRIVQEAFKGGLICALGAAFQVIIRVYGPIWELLYDRPGVWLTIKEAIIVLTGLILGAITGATCQTLREIHRTRGKSKNNWRLHGQELYLKRATLCWRKYERWSENWDHDTCAFCACKFTDNNEPGVLHEGYSTPDGYHWVCKNCFEDFATLFEFNVISRQATTPIGPPT